MSSSLAKALSYRRIVTDNPTLSLLRAELAPIAVALLGEHLGAIGARMDSEDLYEALDTDLETLRDHFSELGQKTARAYCDDWRAKGFLIRRPSATSRGESYELSPEARAAIGFLDHLSAPRTTLTESRLVALASAVRQLAIETDPDVSRRLEALERQKELIEAEIERTRAGEADVLDVRTAHERVDDILLSAQDLPTDFARVRARFEQLNHDLRASILNVDDLPGTVLDDIFRGVNLIEHSPEGQTFMAFAALLRDPEQSASLEADISAVLDRPFAEQLDPISRHTLRTLVRTLKTGSREVHSTLTDFARALRRYVHTQEFQRDRVLRGLLQDALAQAVQAAPHTRPYNALGGELELSVMRMYSVGELAPYDPSDYDTGATLASEAPGVADFASLAAIARESEIDFVELITNVNDTLSRSAPATLGEILGLHPASQGLASIVGLMSLAMQQGEIHPGEIESIEWAGVDGTSRSAHIATHIFKEKVA